MAELKIDDLKPVKSEEVKEPTPHEKAAEKLKEAARALKYGLEPGDEYEIYSLDEIAAMDETERELRAKQHDINVLRAELQDKVAEMRDLKKTNSKMQQTHAAEMQDLKDQLGEMEAAIAALDKSKAEINRERIELIDAAERDDELFTLILNLAQALRRGAEQMAGLAALLEEKVEVRR